MSIQTPPTLLLRRGHIYIENPTPLTAPPTAPPTAVLIQGDKIVWVGTEDGADLIDPSAAIDLDGRLVTPAFLDSHVHATATGLSLIGLDLSEAESLPAALLMIARYAEGAGEAVLVGSGWDESRWPERRAPSRDELDRATGERQAYLTRVDVHSALANTRMLAAVPDLDRQIGAPRHRDDAQVSLTAHHLVRERALMQLTTAQRRAAQQATLDRAAQLGIGAIVEMAGPEVSSEDDLRELLDLSREDDSIDLFAYWGELGRTDIVTELGLAGAGGDLFCDGAIGSHTAALNVPYRDEAANAGHLWLSEQDVAYHVRRCTLAGIQAGFHAIGDRAVGAVLTGIGMVADELGDAAVRRLGHRIEHCEMTDHDAIAQMVRLGLVASVQPMFDRLWGGSDLMYAQRLGSRGDTLNPFAQMAAAGVTLAFGSDAPVTPLDSWASIHAAVFHRTASQRISARAAFRAATTGGWRALGGQDGSGQLAPGSPAYLAIWSPTELLDGLPAGVVGAAQTYTPPTCEATLAAGRVSWDSGLLDT